MIVGITYTVLAGYVDMRAFPREILKLRGQRSTLTNQVLKGVAPVSYADVNTCYRYPC
jgi:hypothetical protein